MKKISTKRFITIAAVFFLISFAPVAYFMVQATMMQTWVFNRDLPLERELDNNIKKTLAERSQQSAFFKMDANAIERYGIKDAFYYSCDREVVKRFPEMTIDQRGDYCMCEVYKQHAHLRQIYLKEKDNLGRGEGFYFWIGYANDPEMYDFPEEYRFVIGNPDSPCQRCLTPEGIRGTYWLNSSGVFQFWPIEDRK